MTVVVVDTRESSRGLQRGRLLWIMLLLRMTTGISTAATTVAMAARIFAATAAAAVVNANHSTALPIVVLVAKRARSVLFTA